MPENAEITRVMPANFQEYYDSLTTEQQQKLAKDASTSTDYLYQIATKRRGAGASVIKRLMSADPNITFEMMTAL